MKVSKTNTQPTKGNIKKIKSIKVDSKAMNPDFSESAKMKVLFGRLNPMFFQTYDEAGSGRGRLSKTLVGSFPRLRDQLAELNRQGATICVAINEIEGDERKAWNVSKVNALFVDLDGEPLKPALLALKRAHLAPHLVVETSPGRFHIYLCVVDFPLQHFKPTQLALAEFCGGDASVCDLPRVMRMPGFFHQKSDPFMSRTVTSSGHPRYNFAEIAQALDIDINAAPSAPLRRSTHDDVAWQQIDEALSSIPADPRPVWLTVGMAIHSFDQGEQGYQRWEGWSRSSKKFNKADQQATWARFTKSGGLTYKTLFYLAKQGQGFRSGSPYTTTDTDAAIDDKHSLTEVGNAERFITKAQGLMCFVHESNCWYAFNGSAWQKDDVRPSAVATQVGLDLEALSNSVSDPDRRNRLAAHAKATQTASKIRAMIELAGKDNRMRMSLGAFDANPWILPVQNGIVDLKNGLFRASSPEDYCIKRANVVYDADAQAPRFLKFVREITCGDEQLAKYIQKALGYSLTGVTTEHCAFFLLGTGRNGKGVLTRVFQRLLGEFAKQLRPEVLMQARFCNMGATPELAMLPGIRMVCVAEVGRSQRFDEVLVKQITGGDKISARQNYGNPFDYFPNFKIWISGNNKPKISYDDYAIWTRFRLIPFNASFEGKEDKELDAQLEAEMAGILNWGIEGCMLWQEEGLIPPKLVDDLKKGYRDEMDTVGNWIDACCRSDKDTVSVSSVHLHESYRKWCSSGGFGEATLNIQDFAQEMAKKGYKKKHKNTGNFYMGIRLTA